MAEARPEPSMEDILASIKRIIAEDPAPPPTLPRTPVAAPAAAVRPEPIVPRPSPASEPPPWSDRATPLPPESILELTERLPEELRPTAPPLSRPPEPISPPVQRAVERLRDAEAERLTPAPRPVPADLLPRTPAPRQISGEVTLDALVREMLEPMLADWIERNLPDMVERIVQSEIRRMTDKDR